MNIEFYGATAEAQNKINSLLNIIATGREQDWEIEFANPNRIDEMLDIASVEKLNFDEKCALYLLIISSIDEALETNIVDLRHVSKLKNLLNSDKIEKEAMSFFWIKMHRATNFETIDEILA